MSLNHVDCGMGHNNQSNTVLAVLVELDRLPVYPFTNEVNLGMLRPLLVEDRD